MKKTMGTALLASGLSLTALAGCLGSGEGASVKTAPTDVAPQGREGEHGPEMERADTNKDGELSFADGELLERLKSWRLGEARTQAVPAFVILHDKTLAEIARSRPRNLDALRGIAGIGATKLERYGPALVELVGS